MKNKFSKSNGWLPFLLDRNKYQILLVGVGLVIAAFLYFRNISSGFEHHWSVWLEAFLAFSILAITLSIWLNEQNEEWVKSLPKRLNASFYLISPDGSQPVKIMECLNAVLINESDIRAWGQQIASQMADGAPLKFSLSIEIVDLKIIENKHYYQLKMYLKSPPEKYGLEAQMFDPNKWIRWTFTDKLKPEEKFFDLEPEN